MFNSDPEKTPKQIKRVRGDERASNSEEPVAGEQRDKEKAGQDAEGEWGSTSGMKGRGCRGGRRGRGRTGRGRGRYGRGRGRSGGRQEESTARKYKRYMEKRIQYAEQAYCENTNKDIRRII